MKKTIDNIVYIMKSFYWTQLKFLLLLSGIIMVAMGIFAFWHNMGWMKTFQLFYCNMFSGSMINDIILWLVIDVIAFSMVYKKITEENQGQLGPVTTGITLFTGIFMGFDIVWLGYFWKKYFVNVLIVGIRIFVPFLLISKMNCCSSNKNNPDNNNGNNDNNKPVDKKIPIKKPKGSVNKTTSMAKKNTGDEKPSINKKSGK
jgi:hypothetical protein